MESLTDAFWVALGAAIGGAARAYLSGLIGRHFGDGFPIGTLLVNVSGALAIGLASAYARRHAFPADSAAWLFSVTGVLGSYTTVSSFSLQTVALAQRGVRRPLFYITLSVIACIAAVAIGYALAGGA
ncbi:MAG TPA: fluoride efflux transporter CrcB [Caulobacterales bacterium]|nr:fluoride efflux transporter CrcB [Caulobacterales bacterium]